MPISLSELVAAIEPHKTVLFLGAGASVDSGAPTGSELAQELWNRIASKTPPSNDLAEVAGILEAKFGRERLILALRERLQNLQPTQGLLCLPLFPWADIYTTNFDQLVERAYGAKHPLHVMRSNYDLSKDLTKPATSLWKLHGCITEDEVDGKNARIIVTERDYDIYSQYREACFAKLQYELYSRDVLFVGYSLRDKHIKDEINRAATIKRKNGGPGKIYALFREVDADYSLLIEQRGVLVAFGTLDSFLLGLEQKKGATGIAIESPISGSLPSELVPTAINIGHARQLEPKPETMCSGRAATYAEISAGLTFVRTAAIGCTAFLSDKNNFAVTILGPSGIGKTTAIRQVGINLAKSGYEVWEHRSGYPFYWESWKSVADTADELHPKLLIVDDCLEVLHEINDLCTYLVRRGNSYFKIALTGHAGLWGIRTKAPVLLKSGAVRKMMALDEGELTKLADLVLNSPAFHPLLNKDAKATSRSDLISNLKLRCHNDMFVALKYLFSFSSIDEILLQEFSILPVAAQRVYKTVAALQAMGMPVHRQLVIRMLNLDALKIADLLNELEGVVFESSEGHDAGVYEWSCRHKVIADVLTQYKYPDGEDLYKLADQAVGLMNLSVHLERRGFNRVMSQEYPSSRRMGVDRRRVLLRRMIDIAPSERVPYHRLIGLLLDGGKISDAEIILERGMRETSYDPPFARYGIEVLLRKADTLPDLRAEDRRALFLKALSEAEHALKRFPDVMNIYRSYATCCLKLWETDPANHEGLLTEAVNKISAAYENLGEPSLRELVDGIERQRTLRSA